MPVKAPDAKSLIAKVARGRSDLNYRKDHIIFTQGEPADAVFYIAKGRVKVTVVGAHRQSGHGSSNPCRAWVFRDVHGARSGAHHSR